jgi:hypothetical protein
MAMLAAGLAFVAGSAVAQTAGGDDEVPARVGRIADLGGDVYHAPEDRASDWSTIGINYPIATGDNLWVAEGGRAEIDVGAGQIRLGGATNIHVARLDDRTVAFFVAQGRVILRLRVLDPGEVARIDTPNTQVVLTRPGLYRIEVSDDRLHTTLVVREGEATLPTPVGMQQVLPGQTALVEGLDNPRMDVRVGMSTDGFDTWSADRDRRYQRSRSATYVSRQMVGYADLDEYGRWEDDRTYGAVWYPTLVDAGWAPYRDGYWTWVGAFGWTWVDYAPWGYAPFHYGRWVHNGGRWGWCPGAYVARPYWAPAMVGWVGGAGWGLSLTFGAPVYGWVPLAWGEPYRPWWGGCGYNCWTHYNRPYAVNVDRRVHDSPPARYVNANRPGGLTAVPSATFSGQKPVRSNLVPVSARDASATPVLATAPTAARPGPGHIPLVKPGTANTPPPASTSYAVGRGGSAITRPGSSLGGSRTVQPTTTIPSGGRAAAPGASTPGPGTAPVTSVPGADKPGSRAAPPQARDSRAPATSRDYPATLPAPFGSPSGSAPSSKPSSSVPPPTRYAAPPPQANAAPGGKPSSQPSSGLPAQRATPSPGYVAPAPRGSGVANGPSQRGSSTPTYTAPVQRETARPYVPPQRAATPQPSPSAGSLPMPPSRVAPAAPPVQYAPPPVAQQPAVVQPAPPSGGGRAARGDASQGGGRNGGGGGDGGAAGAKPGPGR